MSLSPPIRPPLRWNPWRGLVLLVGMTGGGLGATVPSSAFHAQIPLSEAGQACADQVEASLSACLGNGGSTGPTRSAFQGMVDTLEKTRRFLLDRSHGKVIIQSRTDTVVNAASTLFSLLAGPEWPVGLPGSPPGPMRLQGPGGVPVQGHPVLPPAKPDFGPLKAKLVRLKQEALQAAASYAGVHSRFPAQEMLDQGEAELVIARIAQVELQAIPPAS